MPRRTASVTAAALLLLSAFAPTTSGARPADRGGDQGGRAAEADPPSAPASTTATAPAPRADSGRAAPPRRRDLPREANPDDALCAPLLIEPDYGFGTHVVMRRLPNAADFEDLTFVTGLRQVLIALPQWPASYADLKPLQQAILPDGVELVVLLPGWPPTREALGAWNLIGGNLRLILIVDGPPPDRALITELNHMRALERVIAQMEHPARTGFERLQRPLSFRMLKR